MRNKIRTGKGIGGVISYILNDKQDGPESRAEIVGGNLIGNTQKEFISEFSALYSARQAKGKGIPPKPAKHFVLSCPEGEKLTQKQWSDIADYFMKSMGYENTLYLAVRHSDTHLDHCHIAALTINPDGTLVKVQNDGRLAIQACREIERKFGLTSSVAVDHNSRTRKGYTFDNPSNFNAPIAKGRYSHIGRLSHYTKADFSKSKFIKENLSRAFITKEGDLVMRFKNNTTAKISGNKILLWSSNKTFEHQLRQEFKTVLPKKEAPDGASSFSGMKRQALREKRGYAPLHNSASGQGSGQAVDKPASGPGSSRSNSKTIGTMQASITALELDIAQCTDPIQKGRLIAQKLDLERSLKLARDDEAKEFADEAKRQDEEKTTSAKRSLKM